MWEVLEKGSCKKDWKIRYVRDKTVKFIFFVSLTVESNAIISFLTSYFRTKYFFKKILSFVCINELYSKVRISGPFPSHAHNDNSGWWCPAEKTKK